MNIKKIFFLLYTMFFINSVHAWDEADPMYAALPAYCKARLTGKPDPEKWKAKFGPSFIDFHHYCAGLIDISKAHIANNKKDREANLDMALREFQYMIDHSEPKLKLFPKLYYERGTVLDELGNTEEAIKSLRKSIEIEPSHALPYATLSELYTKLKMHKEAKEILEEGLKKNQNSKMLTKKLQKIDAK